MMQKDFDLIIFGATGNLAAIKIFPALFELFLAKKLHPDFRVIATGRTLFETSDFLEKLERDSRAYCKSHDEGSWPEFLSHIIYCSLNVEDALNYVQLAYMLRPSVRDVLIYYSVSPEFFITICKNLASVGLNDARVRLILEKPLGTDLASCVSINNIFLAHYKESQIYRIDHYLGKESVQNILALRFANPWIDAILNKNFLKHIEIEVYESIGVGSRGEFYDNVGALRDMLQNHMMQMLSLLTMSLPKKLDASYVRAHKIQLLRSLRPLIKSELASHSIRAQYSKGPNLNGYKDEKGVSSRSMTETYVALKTFVDSERLEDVPIILKTGKRMQQSYVNIKAAFKPKLGLEGFFLLQIQPKYELKIELNAKSIGAGLGSFDAKSLELDFAQGKIAQSPYASLLEEVIDANASNFNHKDELELAWGYLAPLIEAWDLNEVPLYYYEAGSKGPSEISILYEE